MSLAAVMVAQVDPNSAGAINSGQTNPGTPAGSMTGLPSPQPYTGLPSTQPYTGLPSTQPYGDTGGGANAGGGADAVTGGSGTGAVLPQPYSATPSLTNPVAGAQGDVTGSGAVLLPVPGGMGSPITGNPVSGTGVVLPPDPAGMASPGAGNTVSGAGAVLPPAMGTPAAGAAGTTLSPDTNTSSNSVTPLGGGSILDEGAGR
ncbi:hypothetical protein D7X12_11855 [Corallococcus sicarius]|uniref:Uncharacterized protein n=3 Tax=Corallococcus TaxID=83461 RepID=A0A3A8NS40_9BACT|nr:hypothetical protein D7X12_11855 [Corallococcus sicarius]